MANQLTGKILHIFPTQEFLSKTNGKPFRKREIVLDCARFDPYTGERGYDNTPVFEFTADRCELLDQFQVGQVVTISFDIQGAKSPNSDRYFNSVRGYRIELRNANQNTVPQPTQAQQTVAPQPQQWQQPTAPQQPIQQSNGLPF